MSENQEQEPLTGAGQAEEQASPESPAPGQHIAATPGQISVADHTLQAVLSHNDAAAPGPGSSLSRRQVLIGAGSAGVLAAAPPVTVSQARGRRVPPTSDGTPEQIHLTWGDDPASVMVVSWASPDAAVHPRVLLTEGGGQVQEVPAVQRTYADGINGETVYAYHAKLSWLDPSSSYDYSVTADNDNSPQPFSSTFATAPRGRAPFRFTSFGDLATPNTQWVLSYGQSAYAVAAVESFKPLFHLLNGDLCYGDLNPATQPEVWRDFGNNNQASAANRAWMPCLGNHEVEFYNGSQGFTSYLTRYSLPDNGIQGFRGRWYSFQVGSALFISLDADDVVYQDAGAFVAGPAALTPVASTGNAPVAAGTSFYIRGYSHGLQTHWLERTLQQARRDPSVDWVIVQMHQDACSSSATGNGSDLGIRQEWLPLFDRYHVDLVVNGHDHDYERSFPCRGFDNYVGHEVATGQPVQTLCPHPVTTVDTGAFDTSKGTVHMILGCGGTSANLDNYGVDATDGLPQAKVFTRPNHPVPSATNPGAYGRPPADAVEDAVWSAKRDPSTGYGIAVFDVDPGSKGEPTTITVSYFHAVGADPTDPATGSHGAPTPNYTEFETFQLYRPRSSDR
ncbi:MAG TPA: fibronectin type III domain-containing protein [Streptosporangiaceae bacterium]|nr:fibronectin type III domain-containing protein [Streptosporangiaceae bacterium]